MKQIFDSFYSITLIWALYFDAFYLLFNYTRAPCCWCCMSIDSIAESAANCLVVDVARDGSRPRHATRPPPRGAATLFIAAQYYLKYKYLVLITLTAHSPAGPSRSSAENMGAVGHVVITLLFTLKNTKCT